MSAALKTPAALKVASRLCRLAGSPCLHSGTIMPSVVACDQTRGMKHYNPKFRWLRGKKFIKVDLPNFNEAEEDKHLTPDEVRKKMKDRGMLPPRTWQDRPINISCTGGVFEEYVPPEGDGKVSIVSTTGAKQRLQRLEKKGKSMMSVRKIRSFDEEFEVDGFAETAVEIYRKAHEALTGNDIDTLHSTVTELAYPKMMDNVRYKTVRWQFLRQNEPARVVHVRTTDLVTKENVYAQVTVRLNTQQLLAIYDRFGRLMYGSEVVAKDVLEYVVFEKHLANVYGAWRIHSKIIPDWLPPRDPVSKTWRSATPAPVEEDKQEVMVSTS